MGSELTSVNYHGFRKDELDHLCADWDAKVHIGQVKGYDDGMLPLRIGLRWLAGGEYYCIAWVCSGVLPDEGARHEGISAEARSWHCPMEAMGGALHALARKTWLFTYCDAPAICDSIRDGLVDMKEADVADGNSRQAIRVARYSTCGAKP